MHHVELSPEFLQGTPEWLEFRKKHITATDAPVIMGASPYQTPFELWQRKMGLIPDVEETEAMRRGKALEPVALAEFEKKTGLFMAPAVRVSDKYPFMMASLDGVDITGRYAVEIKCPNKETHQMALDGVVPSKYVYQLQHQMIVLNLDFIYYFSFDGQNGVILEVRQDSEAKDKLPVYENKFWQSILNAEPPELCERDYVQQTDANWIDMANRWTKVRQEIERLEQEEEGYRNALIDLANKQNSQGGGIRLQKIIRKGAVDYSKIPELKGIDLEQYRKRSSESYRLSVVK